MPNTKRSTGSTRASGPPKGQSTISFSNRVTKAVPKDAKKAVLEPSVHKVDVSEKAGKDVADVVPDDELEEVVNGPEDVEEAEEVAEAVPEKSEAELKAEKVTESQINKYWKAIEKERIAPRVHQEGLSLSEKVLRYFDVSSQYGPCIGKTRMKRWQRAERLGLEPPIEVLAVLLREENRGNKDIETAHLDKLMNQSIAA